MGTDRKVSGVRILSRTSVSPYQRQLFVPASGSSLRITSCTLTSSNEVLPGALCIDTIVRRGGLPEFQLLKIAIQVEHPVAPQRSETADGVQWLPGRAQALAVGIAPCIGGQETIGSGPRPPLSPCPSCPQNTG